ncbi:MAG: cell division protein ZapA [Thermoanaerobaculia bacterium]
MGDGNQTTQVEIFGSVYHVRSDDDATHLQEVAAVVDRTMREIAGKVSTVDTAKIAILAALNLADELSRTESEQRGERVEIQERLAALNGELSDALHG